MNSILKISLLCIVVFATSCSPVYYTPEAHQTPLLQEKGELSVTGHATNNAAGIQAAYAIGNKINVAVDFNNIKSESRYGLDAQNSSETGGKLFGLGLGYNITKNNNLISEAFLLFNRGNVESEYREYLNSGGSSAPDDGNWGNLTADINKISAQYNIGYKGNNLEIITSLRAGYLNYSNVEGDLMYRNVDHIDLLSTNSKYLTVSPALTFRAGIKNVKFHAQVVNVFVTPLGDRIDALNTEKTRLSIGATFNLQTLSK